MSRRRVLAVAIVSMLVASSFGGITADEVRSAYAATNPNASQVAKALDYLHACQNSDGGFAEKDSASSDSLTAWAIIAIASAGEDPNAWRVNGVSPVDFLSQQSAKWRQTTDVARTLLAVIAARKDPHGFGGVDLVARLHAAARESGSDAEQIGPYVNSHIWAMIALKAADDTLSDKDVRWLLAEQNSDGGWGWAPGVASDSNDTAAALEALAAAGVGPSSSNVTRALSYLRERQAADGGFTYASGTASDANSTSWVVQGLIAAGQKPSSWVLGGHDPLSALSSLQVGDGSERYSASQSSNPLLSTAQALPAFSERAFPTPPAPKGVESPWRPIISAMWPKPGASVVPTAGSMLTFAVSDGAGTGVAPSGATVCVDGKRLPVSSFGGAWRATLSGLSPGAHAATITATDRAGNEGTFAGWRFTITAIASGASLSSSLQTLASSSSTLAARFSSAGTQAVASEQVHDPAASVPSSDSARVSSTPGADAWIGLWVAALGALLALAVVAAVVAVHYRRRRRGEAS